MTDHRFHIASIAILWLFACSNPEEALQNTPSFPDTLDQIVTDGITLQLRGLRDQYGLDDNICGVLLAVNSGSQEPLYLWTSNLPQYGWSVHNLQSIHDRFPCTSIISPSEWRDTLEIGDTLSFLVKWMGQTCIGFQPMKAFSGIYKLRVSLGGNPLLKSRVLTKFIWITDIGQPLSSVLARLNSPDSVNVDFLVRNRVAWPLQYPINDPRPVKVFLVSQGDTLSSLTYPVPFSILLLPPHSDTVVFRFRAAESDTMFDAVRGRGLFLSITLHLKGEELTPEQAFFFFP